jgi:hypothetical protein
MKFSWIVCLIVVSFSLAVKGQISEGGLPYYWNNTNTSKSKASVILPGVNAIKPAERNAIHKKGESFTFAKLFTVNASLCNSGQWTQLSNGDKIWQLSFRSDSAYSLNVQFSNYLLPEGARLFIYNADHTQVIGAFTCKNNKEWRGLATMPVAGDEITIEYYEPADAAFPGELTVGSIGHDYLNIFGKKDGQSMESGACNIDINCPEGVDWQVQKRAICRLLIGGSTLCSGSLINNALKDQTPYVLTANHCIDNDILAQSTVFVFNYEHQTCGGTGGSVSQSVSGADLVATKNQDHGYLDFTLLKLNEKIPMTYQPYFAGWDSRDIVPDKATCIHHPWGDVKKISIENDPLVKSSYLGYGYDPQSHWKIQQWDAGTTEGGSSGSPIFNSSKRIVGSLSGGDADCTSSVNDYYQMVSTAYSKYPTDSTSLKHWLDPSNSGVQYLDGYDPLDLGGDVTDLINVVHWKEGQNIAFYVANKGGYIAGNNVYQDKAKAEFFNSTEFTPLNLVSGAYVAFGFASGRDNELIELQVLSDDAGLPANYLGSAYVTLGEIKQKADKDYVYFHFNPPVEVTGSIYLSVVLPQYPGDTVALMTVEESVVNTCWELNYYNQWYPYSDADNSWNIKLSHLIAMEIGRYSSIDPETNNNSDLSIYPNPAEQMVTLEGAVPFNSRIRLFDTYGRKIDEMEVNSNNSIFEYNVSGLKTGLYILQIETSKGLITKKFIKQ